LSEGLGTELSIAQELGPVTNARARWS